MFMSIVNDSLCLKKEHITEFHDNIIIASYIAKQKHIPYSHKSKTKVIPGWDIEMDIFHVINQNFGKAYGVNV